MPDAPVTLTLPLPMVRTILHALAELPFKVAAEPIHLIQQQLAPPAPVEPTDAA